MKKTVINPKIDSKEFQTYFEIAKNSALLKGFYPESAVAETAAPLTKDELIALLKSNFNLNREKSGVYLVRSGGTARKPLIFPVDIAENQQQRLELAKSLSRDKLFSPQTIALNIFGYSDMYRTAAILDDILEKCSATTLPMSAHAAYQDIVGVAEQFKPDFILGTPSKLLRFAQFLEEKQQKLEIASLLYSGEFLRPSLQAIFKKRFGIRNIYSLYGSAETGIWAWSDYSSMPTLFKVIKGIIVEILNPDKDGFGTISVTNTFRKRFPIFRYAIGDIGRWVCVDNISYLELKSREGKSFLLGEQHFYLEDFQSITENADAFQICLGGNRAFQEEITILLVQSVPTDEVENFLQEKTKLLQEIISYKWAQPKINLVSSEKLHCDPNTSKTPPIRDMRI